VFNVGTSNQCGQLLFDFWHLAELFEKDELLRNQRLWELHDSTLSHASFIGFTGTPIEKTDANTRTVFGDYV